MKKIYLHLLSISLILAGCGKSDAGKETQTKKVIAISVMTMGNPFFVELAEAAKAEAAKHGYKTIIVGGEEADNQAKQIRDFITKKVDAIIISPKDTKAIGSPIKEANAAGIPVFTADTGCTDESAKVICNVMTDNYGGGKLAAQAMIEALENKGGKVLILDYNNAQSCQERVKGFKEIISEYNSKSPGAKIDIVAELPGQASEEPSKKATEDQLNATPDLAGVFAINDPSALGAVVALKQAGKLERVKVIGFDGQMIGKIAIKKGEIYADPIQFPKEIGAKTVQQIIAYKNGDKVESEILIPTKLYRQEDAQKDSELEGK
ncbi:MAG: substrate-binding domain-containing protein [Lentisphaeraceae bacterium]|nr:substrate-binding domain-containing protein [Lentisphaeraceae bacterium]